MNHFHLTLCFFTLLTNNASATSISSDPADLLKRGSAFTKVISQKKDVTSDFQSLPLSTTRQLYNQIRMSEQNDHIPLYQNSYIERENQGVATGETPSQNNPVRTNGMFCCWAICGTGFCWG